MKDHLPECPVPAMEARHGPLHPEDAEANCICAELRACEQRVRAEYYEYKAMLGGIEYGAERSWDYALDAARAAVIGTCGHTKYEGCSPCSHDDAVAAIDALRTGQEAGDLPGNEQPDTSLADHPFGDGSAMERT